MYAVYQGHRDHRDHYTVDQDGVDVQRFGGRRIDRPDLLPGDPVFFGGAAGETRPGHVGIYIGSDQVIDAYNTGVDVGVRDFSDESGGYWGAVRYWD